MKQPNFWKYNSPLSTILLPLSFFYRFISVLNQILKPKYKAEIPVICVGNVTAGGAGKTPTAIAIAKILLTENKKIVFLSRGYSGKLRGTFFVDSKIHKAHDVGDEPLLLAKTAPVIISKDRRAGAQLAHSRGAEVIIMDDGLQNPTLEKTISFLVIDGNFGLGNGKIIPAGPLRQTLKSAIKQVDATILIGNDVHNISKKLNDTKLITAKIVGTPNPENKHYVAFAGIANPAKFFTSLRQYNYNVVEEINFPDHYNFTKNDIENLKKKAHKLEAELITTEKDFVRLSEEDQVGIQTLPIEIVWNDINIIKNILKK
jgi:tetraacyldisaccharide 4'-kinase